MLRCGVVLCCWAHTCQHAGALVTEQSIPSVVSG